MPSVYQIQVLNHLVDAYDATEREVVKSERWLKSCSDDVTAAWDAKDIVAETRHHTTGLHVDEARAQDARIQRRIRETTNLRHQAEYDLSIAREREKQAMRTLCDAVLLAARAAKGSP